MGREDGGVVKFNEIEIPLLKEPHVLEISGILKTTDTAPTHTPKRFSEQFIIYANGATYRLYIYDIVNKAWRYVALT